MTSDLHVHVMCCQLTLTNRPSVELLRNCGNLREVPTLHIKKIKVSVYRSCVHVLGHVLWEGLCGWNSAPVKTCHQFRTFHNAAKHCCHYCTMDKTQHRPANWLSIHLLVLWKELWTARLSITYLFGVFRCFHTACLPGNWGNIVMPDRPLNQWLAIHQISKWNLSLLFIYLL